MLCWFSRDKPLLASKTDKYVAVVMIILAIFTSVVAVSTNIFNLIQPVEPSATIPAASGFTGYYLGL
jgi:hypothetical protein